MYGIDVEFFAVNSRGYGVPALEVFAQLPNIGSYERVEVEKNYGAGKFMSAEYKTILGNITEDGLAIELPVTPAESPGKVFASLRELKRVLSRSLRTLNLALTTYPKVDFAKSFLTRPELRVLGCSPDQSIYSGETGRPNVDPRKMNWRTSGGHWHFSCGVKSMEDVQKFILMCDLTLGLADVVLDHSELAQRRRDLYGQPGKFRVQKHGIEYRTCSSVWASTAEIESHFGILAGFLHTNWSTFDIYKAIQNYNVPELLETIQFPGVKWNSMCSTIKNWFADLGYENTYESLLYLGALHNYIVR